jgi:Nif-specific regulatory protein
VNTPQRELPLPGAHLALHGIYEISKILCGPGSLYEVLSGTLHMLHSFLRMAHGVIAVLDASGVPETMVAASLDPAGARHYFRALPEKVVGQIMVTGMPVVVGNVANDPAFAGCDNDLRGEGLNVAFIGVPICDRGRVIGAITIDRPWLDPRDLRTDEDVRVLKMTANLIGQTVRLHRMAVRNCEQMRDDQQCVKKERANPAAELRRPGSPLIVGESKALQAVLEHVQLVAGSSSPVLLRGESGTGKELFARALHEGSPRRAGPFITLSCAALPVSVLESELFGHEKGSFTGALTLRKGRFELAHGGTLFLDEIGEIPAAFQTKLLRVLQEGEFERVGGTCTLKVNVRLVSATNRNLERAVIRGAFPADLYYRLSVVPIFLPPLRDRLGDIPLLAREFLHRLNNDNKTSLSFAPGSLAVLEQCEFPGNVRELENCVRRTATLSRGQVISEYDFACRNDGCPSAVLWRKAPAPVIAAPVAPAPVATAAAGCGAHQPCRSAATSKAPLAGAGLEYHELLGAMERSGWVQAKAARLLNWTPRQIGYALRKHGIPIKSF